jgi:mono/diheme cytochrome c family protein
VTGDPAPLIATVLYGRNNMPAMQDSHSSEELAAVLTFVRSAWGNQAEPVAAQTVDEVRRQ